MSILSDEFEFEIGDVVYHKAALHTDRHTPPRFMITERVLQECHGGKQRLYKLDEVNRLVPELMLTRERPPFEAESPEELARRWRINDTALEMAQAQLAEKEDEA